MPVSKQTGPAAAPPPAVATPGRIVLYRLDEGDAAAITRRRIHASEAPAHQWGSQTHYGNTVQAGDVYPAIVVRVFDQSRAVNVQVFLDGSDTHWATSRVEGGDPGQWSWPVRS